MQGPAAGGETWAEASAGAAQTGAAQRAGDGPAAPLRPGDGAAQEAAEAGGGQRCWQAQSSIKETFLIQTLRQFLNNQSNTRRDKFIKYSSY